MQYDCSSMPTIRAFLNSDAFIRGLVGPLGSGKSSAAAVEIASRGVAQKPSTDGVRRSRWAVIRNTAKQLEDTSERTFLQWFPPTQFGDWTPSKHNYTLKALRAPGDDKNAVVEILFRALDRPDQISDLLSLELTGAWVNEAREVPWPVIDALQGRVGRYPRRADAGAYWSGIWLDTNPPDVDSDFYKFFEITDHTEAVAELAKIIPGLTVESYRQVFKQPSGMSPQAENLANLQEGYYQRIAIGKTDEWVKVFVHGQYGFTVDGKAVWPEYNDAMHCPAEKRLWPRPIPGLPIYRGWDFGLQPAVIFTQLTPKGQWIVFDEMIGTSIGADAISDEVLDHSLREYYGFEFRDFGDPAGRERVQTDEKTAFNILWAKGIEIEPGLQTPSIRWESVRKTLRTLVDGKPQFLIHPRCSVLRRGMLGGYHFRRLKVSGERYTREAEKNTYSHPCDALAYIATRLFGVPLLNPQGALPDHDPRAAMRDQSRSRVTGY
jgi:hypothetical protein